MPRNMYFINVLWEIPWVLLFVTDYSQHLGFLPEVSKTGQSLQKKVPLMSLAPLGHPFIRYFQNTLILYKLW